MKTLVALSLAVVVTVGSMASAAAFVHPLSDLEASAEQLHPNVERTHFDRCHGRTSGTAHESCGTATGGPVGGLF